MKNIKIVDKKFFIVDAVTLAKNLLGKNLCRNIDGIITKYPITETEAYIANIDSACHAYRGKTNRNRALFAEGGHAYIHICYGIHFMLNITSGKKDEAEGVLIRGAGKIKGPGNLTKILKIDKSLYLEDLTTSNELWIEEGSLQTNYIATKRIGINYALEEDVNRLWRFVVK